MKNWLAIALFAGTTLAQAATYNLLTLTSNLPEDAGKVYSLQIVVDQNQNIKQLYLPALNPTTDCPISLTPDRFISKFVTMKFEEFEKLSNGSCKYKGRPVLNVGLYDSSLIASAGPRSNNVIPFWVDYLVNGLTMNRSEKMELELAYNYKKGKWEVLDKNSERVVSNIQFLVNKFGFINIGVAKHTLTLE